MNRARVFGSVSLRDDLLHGGDADELGIGLGLAQLRHVVAGRRRPAAVEKVVEAGERADPVIARLGGVRLGVAGALARRRAAAGFGQPAVPGIDHHLAGDLVARHLAERREPGVDLADQRGIGRGRELRLLVREVARGIDREPILRQRHGAVAQGDARPVLPVGDGLERRAALEALCPSAGCRP